MAAPITVDVQAFGPIKGGDLVVFVDDTLKVTDAISARFGTVADTIGRVAASERFKGKPNSALVIHAPQGIDADRLIAIGIGGEKDRETINWLTLGGLVAGKVLGRTATVLFDPPGAEVTAEGVGDLALGARLRAYSFDRYKTKKKKDNGTNDPDTPTTMTFMVADPSAAKRAVAAHDGLVEGVNMARDLVNEPPNVLGPEEFAQRAQKLSKVGVEVEVLDEAELKELGMRALVAVGQGSARESRVVVMRWTGVRDDEAPLVFIGKGVCFDSGGISIKPGGGMEDMKGDMAGAACVVGLMHALAARKARANVVGIIGLVENMPSGDAQRPGDIVTTLSGQTVEIINTDAEGRLVLADLLWYAQDRFKPKFMIDLATLTGAILVALAQEYAGLFSNNDELAARLTAVGQATGEKVWRMPLGPEYDKLIDSKFADMKNVGGRHGGSITAAQFLQRFVNNVPWAHLDIAGTGMNAPQTEVNKSWGSGWGVRLLDRLVRDQYEG
jgi:leucyl aminopeptidase